MSKGSLMKYFRPHEFECKCYKCGLGFAAMDVDFLDRLDMARMYADYPFILTSAIRCEAHNKDVGGLDNSAHLRGLGADIETKSSYARFKVLYGLVKAGFKRIIIYKTFIHVDDDPSKPQEIVDVGWLNLVKAA